MPRTCTICNHADREAIDKSLAAGKPLRDLSALFRVSEDALARHRDAHLPQAVAQAQADQDQKHGDDLLGDARKLQQITLAILGRAETAGDNKTALLAVREARGNLELLGKLLGELDDRPQVNVLVASPEWLAIRTAILRALTVYPDARAAVLEALGDGRIV